jgi:hypothetical protein
VQSTRQLPPTPSAHDAYTDQGKHNPAQIDPSNNEAALRAILDLILCWRMVPLLLLVPFTNEPERQDTSSAVCERSTTQLLALALLASCWLLQAALALLASGSSCSRAATNWTTAWHRTPTLPGTTLHDSMPVA